jgi:UDP-GlcNAc:undecaprenyl-phosphate GlcNAc-1-phosphate transferase
MHLHHRLLEIGNSHTKAVLLMWFWAALLGFGGVAASFSSGPVMVLAIVAGLALLSLLTLRSPRPRSPL